MSRFYVGIDPGRNGAVAVVDSDGKYITAHVMPTLADRVDPRGLHKLLSSVVEVAGLVVERTHPTEFPDSRKDALVYLEKPIAMPRQSSVSTLSTGINFGYCEMALAAIGLSYELVVPKKWMTEMHQGIESKIADPKLRSALKAQRLLGLDPFMLGKRKKPHDGLVDAYLIAMYAFRKNGKGRGDAA